MYDVQYIMFHQLLQFNPELVLVSAGFDAAGGDPLGHFTVTPVGYAQFTQALLKFAGGRVVLVLEGGYNLVAIAESYSASVATLLGDAFPPIPENKTPNDEY